jgi:hypothetical protein
MQRIQHKHTIRVANCSNTDCNESAMPFGVLRAGVPVVSRCYEEENVVVAEIFKDKTGFPSTRTIIQCSWNNAAGSSNVHENATRDFRMVERSAKRTEIQETQHSSPSLWFNFKMQDPGTRIDEAVEVSSGCMRPRAKRCRASSRHYDARSSV